MKKEFSRNIISLSALYSTLAKKIAIENVSKSKIARFQKNLRIVQLTRKRKKAHAASG